MRSPSLKISLSLIFAATSALAQSGTSAITGTVKDSTGSIFPAAAVRVLNEQSGTQQAISTNESGIYRAGSLVPGTYRIEVEAQGFQKLVRGPINVEVGQIIGLDLTLEVGSAAETVTV